MRLGFVVKPLARPELKSHDSRRWQNSPHLTVSLAYLRDVFGYLKSAGIAMYRMSSDLAPYASHPDMPQFRDQVAGSAAELAEIGALARGWGLRLSFHAVAATVINSPDPRVAAHAAIDLNTLASILDGMGMGPESVVVTHIGGTYGSPEAARERCVHAIDALPPATRSRLVIENDDVRFGVRDALWVRERAGIPVVFDRLHHRLKGWDEMPEQDALAACLATWPAGVRPKIHWSAPRTEWLVEDQAPARDRTPATDRGAVAGRDAEAPLRGRQTRWMYHSDYVNPFEFIDFLRAAGRNSRGLLPFDIMLEARAKDLALAQLRRDLARYAPDLAEGLEPAAIP
jgi:UV DNA damage endonuclease